jgi:hypothetical protein
MGNGNGCTRRDVRPLLCSAQDQLAVNGMSIFDKMKPIRSVRLSKKTVIPAPRAPL